MANNAISQRKANSKTNSRTPKKSEETPMAKDKETQSTKLSIQKPQAGKISLVEPSIPLPGNRPIATSSLKVSDQGSIRGIRPIDTSELQIVGTLSSMGERPITASNMQIRDVMVVSGNRPISVSTLHLENTEMILGNRPIASNVMEEADEIMGYLD
ncbi:MAG: hypothetical protein RH949_06165 [Coleofasciculus sp. A1-SPW-01]|uniref:hypothetical protein n=1 Tax=Coleofasciculus sp. A1-SPW-01 TaxID=3070819 RepID=UPI0032F55B21